MFATSTMLPPSETSAYAHFQWWLLLHHPATTGNEHTRSFSKVVGWWRWKVKNRKNNATRRWVPPRSVAPPPSCVEMEAPSLVFRATEGLVVDEGHASDEETPSARKRERRRGLVAGRGMQVTRKPLRLRFERRRGCGWELVVSYHKKREKQSGRTFVHPCCHLLSLESQRNTLTFTLVSRVAGMAVNAE